MILQYLHETHLILYESWKASLFCFCSCYCTIKTHCCMMQEQCSDSVTQNLDSVISQPFKLENSPCLDAHSHWQLLGCSCTKTMVLWFPGFNLTHSMSHNALGCSHPERLLGQRLLGSTFLHHLKGQGVDHILISYSFLKYQQKTKAGKHSIGISSEHRYLCSMQRNDPHPNRSLFHPFIMIFF